MREYLNVLEHILQNGDVKTDRTGTGTTSCFGGMMTFSLRHGIWPLVTTRKVAHEKISKELEWMIKGIVSVQWLKDADVHIWDSWMGPESGTIGPMYGEQWRNWNAGGQKLTQTDWEIIKNDIADAIGKNNTTTDSEMLAETATGVVKDFLNNKRKLFQDSGGGGVDQLANMLQELKNNPDSRRMVVNVWHAGLLPDNTLSPSQNADQGRMALAPCHSTWQINTAPMSDMELLRYGLDFHDGFTPIREMTLENYTNLMSHEVEDLIRAQANQFLLNLGWIDAETTDHQQAQYFQDHQFVITEKGQETIDAYKAEFGTPRKLSLLCYARSQDVPLGTVFNVGMYSLLAHLLAEVTGMIPWEYIHVMGDYHIYHNQQDAVKELLSRTPMPPARVIVDPSLTDLFYFKSENLQVFYKSHPAIKFPMAAV